MSFEDASRRIGLTVIQREGAQTGREATGIRHYRDWGGTTPSVQSRGLDEFLPASRGRELVSKSARMGDYGLV